MNKSDKERDTPRIIGIYLENFQSIEGPVKLDLGAINLLVGPNSVGKSAVFDAIELFRDVIDGKIHFGNAALRNTRELQRGNGSAKQNFSVGIQISLGESAVRRMYGRFDHYPEDLGIEYRIDPELIDIVSGSRSLELRLSNTSISSEKIEVLVDGEAPLLTVGEEPLKNFFDVLSPSLPREYVGAACELGRFLDPPISWGDYEDLHEFLSNLSKGITGRSNRDRTLDHKPRIYFGSSVCEVDLAQALGRALLKYIDQDPESLLEGYIQEATPDTFRLRGLNFSHFNMEKAPFFEFSPPRTGLLLAGDEFDRRGLQKHLNESLTKPVFPNDPTEVVRRGEAFCECLNDFFVFVLDLFSIAIRPAHVPASRPIIDSNEPVHLAHPEAWDARHGMFRGEELDPTQPGGMLIKFHREEDFTSFSRMSSFRGYEHFLAEYAWRMVGLAEPKEEEVEDRSPPGDWHDFPNDALKRYLPSLSQYRIKRLGYEVWRHWTNQNDGEPVFIPDHPLDGNTLVFFKVLDTKSDKLRNFHELGSGISFVFPILVALGESDLSLVEQPELHLHPRAQAEIGDLLIAARNEGRASIVETHSEQLLLRLSQRLRETFLRSQRSGDAVETMFPELEVDAEDIRIFYFQGPTEANQGTQIIELRLAQDGSLVDDWPDGFFDKDDIHTFSRLQLFSGKVDLEKVRERWPWIGESKETPDIVKWLSYATVSTLNDGMFRVEFPLYASKIGQKLFHDKILVPFKEAGSFESIEQGKGQCPIHDFLVGERHALSPTFGQICHFLKRTARDFRSSESRLVTEFRNHLKVLPWKDRALLRDEEFIGKIKRLADLRNGSAHIEDADLSDVEALQSLLFDGYRPGSMLRALGFTPD